MKKTLFIFLLLAVKSQAQVNPELADLISKSFSFFPKVAESGQNVELLQQRLALAELAKMPVLNGSAGYSYVNPVPVAEFSLGPLGVERVAFQPHNNVATGLNFSWPILDFGRQKASIEKSKAELSAGQHQADLVKNQLAAQISQIYYTIIYLKKAVAVEDSVIKFWEESRLLVTKAIDRGNALELDQLNVNASFDAEINRREDLANMLQKQLILLQYTTGEKDINGQNFDFPLIIALDDQLLSSSENLHPDFLIVKDRIQQAKAEETAGKATYYPLLTASGSTGFRNGIQPDIYQMRFNYSGGISLSVPIYNGGRNSQSVKIAAASRALQEQNLVSLKQQYQRDINQAKADIASNRLRLEHTASQILQAATARKITLSRITAGVVTHPDLTNAIAVEQRALLNELQYKYQLILGYIELNRLSGMQYW